MLKKCDVLFVLLIVFGIALSFIVNNGNNKSLTSWSNSNKPESENVYAIIKCEDRLVKTINLSKLTKRETIKIPGKYNEFAVADQKKICFMSADCPDRLCVKSGWIDKPGQIAVCLPNRTIIKIVNNNSLEGFGDENIP